jgi:hypothetical protein
MSFERYADTRLLLFFIGIVFVLNIVYLILVSPKSKTSSRIARLVNLWFEANFKSAPNEASIMNNDDDLPRGTPFVRKPSDDAGRRPAGSERPPLHPES